MPKNDAPKKRKKYLGPESDFYDELKGQIVKVEMDDGSDLIARLVWVDRFTIGLMDLGTRKRSMWYKHSIRGVERSEEHGAPGNSG